MKETTITKQDEKLESLRKMMLGARWYLERNGMDIIGDSVNPEDPIQFVAKEGDDTLVFIRVQVEQEADVFPDEGVNRLAFERFAADWLIANEVDDDNIAIRFDAVLLLKLRDSRAFLRHHRNCLSCNS